MTITYRDLNQYNEGANANLSTIVGKNPRLAAYLANAQSQKDFDDAIRLYEGAGGKPTPEELQTIFSLRSNRAAAAATQAVLDEQLTTSEKTQQEEVDTSSFGLIEAAPGGMLGSLRNQLRGGPPPTQSKEYQGILVEMERKRAQEKKDAVASWRKAHTTLLERMRSDQRILAQTHGFTPTDEADWRYGSLDGSKESLEDRARSAFLAKYGEDTKIGKKFRDYESKRFGIFLGQDARLQAVQHQVEAHYNARIAAMTKTGTLPSTFDGISKIAINIHGREMDKFLSRIPQSQLGRVQKYLQGQQRRFVLKQRFGQLGLKQIGKRFWVHGFKGNQNYFNLLREMFFTPPGKINLGGIPTPRVGKIPNTGIREAFGGKKNLLKKSKFIPYLLIGLGVFAVIMVLMVVVNEFLGGGGGIFGSQQQSFLFTCDNPATADLSIDNIAQNFSINYDLRLDTRFYMDNPTTQKTVALLVYNTFCDLFSNPTFKQIYWNAPQPQLLTDAYRNVVMPVSNDVISHMSHDSGDWGYLKYALDHPCDGYFVKRGSGLPIIKDVKTSDLSSLVGDHGEGFYLVLPDLEKCGGGAAQAEFIVAQKMSMVLANMYFKAHSSEEDNFHKSVVNADGLLPLMGCKGTDDPTKIDGNKLYTCFADMIAEYFLYNSSVGTFNGANYADGLANVLINNCPNPDPTRHKNKEGWVIDAANFDPSHPQNDVSKCIAGVYPDVVQQSLKESVSAQFAGYHLQCVGFAQAAAAGMLPNNTITHPLGGTGTGFAKGYIDEYQSGNPPSKLFRFVKNNGNIQPGDIALYDWGKGGHIDVVTAVSKDNNGVVRFNTAGGSGGDCDSAPKDCAPGGNHSYGYYSYGTVYRGRPALVTEPNLAGWLVPVQQTPGQ